MGSAPGQLCALTVETVEEIGFNSQFFHLSESPDTSTSLAAFISFNPVSFNDDD